VDPVDPPDPTDPTDPVLVAPVELAPEDVPDPVAPPAPTVALPVVPLVGPVLPEPDGPLVVEGLSLSFGSALGDEHEAAVAQPSETKRAKRQGRDSKICMGLHYANGAPIQC